METLDEHGIEELLTRLRSALYEKLASSRALKEAFVRDVSANSVLRSAKEDLRNVSFEEIREI